MVDVARFPGILSQEPNGLWRLRFFDWPSISGIGANLEEAIDDAVRVFWKEHELRPEAESFGASENIEDAIKAARVIPGEALVMVQIVFDKGRTVRLNVSMDEGLLSSIEEASNALGISKSAYVVSAVREKLADGR